MRRKPNNQGGNGGYNNNQQRNKPRYQGGGHNNPGGSHGSHGNRPRKNWAAAQAKYLEQARSALAAGDRVQAENWYQHADHCYRMMVEEGYQVRNSYTPPAHPHETQHGEQPAEAPVEGEGSHTDETATAGNAVSALPAFLTAGFDPAQVQPVEPVIVPSWEE